METMKTQVLTATELDGSFFRGEGERGRQRRCKVVTTTGTARLVHGEGRGEDQYWYGRAHSLVFTEVSKLVVNMNHNSGEIATLGNLAIEAAILGLVLQSVS